MVVDAFADIPVRCTARPSFPYHTPKLPATDLTAEETAWTATAVHAASALDAVKALGNGITAEAAAAYALGFVAGAIAPAPPLPAPQTVTPAALAAAPALSPAGSDPTPPLYHAHHTAPRATAGSGRGVGELSFQSPFDPAAFQRMSFLVPVKHNHRISFTWCLPPQ